MRPNHRHPGRTPIIVSLGALLAAGCGNSGQSVDPGTQPTTASERLLVEYGASAVSVSLGSVPTTAYKGVELVSLADVWAAAELTVDAASLEFGFEGDDGFTPASKECADLPGSLLEQGYVHPLSRNLIWDEALGLRGCYSVDAAKKMIGHEPFADAGVDGK